MLLNRVDPIAKLHELAFRPLRALHARRQVDVPSNCLVSVVLVTNRPEQLDHGVSSFERQTYPHLELVLVTNGGDFDAAVLDQLATRPNVRYITTPAAMTLGDALNAGVAASTGSILAKFDDDDHYGPEYLTRAVEAMRATQAAVIGQKTYYLYLAALDKTFKIYPGNEGKRVGRVAGGSLVWHRQLFDKLRFPSVNLAEDVRFVRAVERRGYAVHSSAAGAFLQWRNPTGHTWEIAPEEVVRVAEEIGRGHDPLLWT